MSLDMRTAGLRCAKGKRGRHRIRKLGRYPHKLGALSLFTNGEKTRGVCAFCRKPIGRAATHFTVWRTLAKP